MAARWPAPTYDGLGPRADARDLVIKVKHGGTLKRFSAFVNGSHFDHDLASLRSKIASAFKFSPDTEFILTYTDEDGDVVMLDDDHDLRDAAINQKLNPLRINVQLKSCNVSAPRAKQQASNSRSPGSIPLEDQLAQVKSAIDDALKFVPEQVPVVLGKLSHDLRSKAASSAPALAELLDRFAKLMTPRCNVQLSCGPADGSSHASSGGPQTLGNSKIKNEPMDTKKSQTSIAPGLKSVPSEAPTAKIEHASVAGLLTGYDLKDNAGTEIKRKSDDCSKGKSVISSVPPVSSTSQGAPAQRSHASSIPERMIRRSTSGSNGKTNGVVPSPFPPSAAPRPQLVVRPYNHFGANGKTNADLYSTFPPPPSIYSPFKWNTPSSASPYFPNLEGMYSTGSSHRDHMPSSLDNYYVPTPEGSFGRSYRGLGANYGSIPQRTLHRWIQCDGCGVTPIVGPRYKSNVKEDYDLCGACFSHMGNEAEYTKLDRPASKSVLAVKTDCRFIKDVTVPDGTPMAPSTPFTKIWRIQNNGYTMWPYGTRLVWVGGDHFGCLSPCRLAISVNEGLNPGQETDVTVDFLAPAKPGRYISYWSLELPSGQKFGQRFWVDIQVEQPAHTSGNKQAAVVNLNLPPQANSRKLQPVTSVDMNTYHNMLERESMKLKEYDEPVPSDIFSFSAPAAVKPVQNSNIDVPASSAEALASMPAVEAAPEANPMPNPAPEANPMPNPAPEANPMPYPACMLPAPATSVPSILPVTLTGPATAPVTAPAPVSVPAAPLPDETMNRMEEKLLGELEFMGFKQADLNKMILRQNNYDLEQSVVDLSSFNEWDPLIEDFSELGFSDAVVKKEVVESEDSDDGYIKLLATDLLARTKE